MRSLRFVLVAWAGRLARVSGRQVLRLTTNLPWSTPCHLSKLTSPAPTAPGLFARRAAQNFSAKSISRFLFQYTFPR
jgi:hypothetical protein